MSAIYYTFFFFTQVWLPFKITLVVLDSQIILLLHQPSGMNLELVGQQTRGLGPHQELIGRSMEVTVLIHAKKKYIYLVNKPLWAAGISEDSNRHLRATEVLKQMILMSPPRWSIF